FSNWIRNSDNTVKPDAFIPYPHPDLSVTRHINLSEEVLWKIGQDVADARSANLYGRADIYASTARRQNLRISAAPVPNNPNHTNIDGWPADKPAQKMIALQLAADSAYRAKR
ncbi:MAG: hypothetical protein WAX67_11505, partial [Rugosibacter sp.]